MTVPQECSAAEVDDDHEILDRLFRRLFHRPVPGDYPLHGICRGCAEPVTQASPGAHWVHDEELKP